MTQLNPYDPDNQRDNNLPPLPVPTPQPTGKLTPEYRRPPGVTDKDVERNKVQTIIFYVIFCLFFFGIIGYAVLDTYGVV